MTTKDPSKDPRRPTVQLTVNRALRRAGYDSQEIDQYITEAQSGDYNHLLQVTMKWVEVA